MDKKRKMVSTSQSGQSKKQRSDASSAKDAPDVQAGGVKSRKTLGAAVQSACYAIERLTAQSKCILHTIGVTLEGENDFLLCRRKSEHFSQIAN